MAGVRSAAIWISRTAGNVTSDSHSETKSKSLGAGYCSPFPASKQGRGTRILRVFTGETLVPLFQKSLASRLGSLPKR
jgi:hypothetical protein